MHDNIAGWILNSAVLDQTAPKEQSDLDLQCLPSTRIFCLISKSYTVKTDID